MTAPKTTDKPSTKHHQVDARFAALLTEDFGIEMRVILDALEGEPKKQAIAVCEWAEGTDYSAYALRCWARRHGWGAYRVAPVARDSIREQQDERRRGTPPARRRGGSCGLDPAKVRANVERMGD